VTRGANCSVFHAPKASRRNERKPERPRPFSVGAPELLSTAASCYKAGPVSADGPFQPPRPPGGLLPTAEELAEERALCDRAHTGDRAALGALLRQHGPRLFRAVLLPRLGSRAAAEEALSVTYLKVVERFDQFSWQAVGVYPWLRVVALRVALDQLRARKRETLFQPDDLEREIDEAERAAQDHVASEAHDLAVAKQRVVELVGRLHPRYGKALTLRVIEERSREECARQLSVTTSTFDVVLHRAVAALKKELAREPS
jgi:RNA polymerase sigma factor (sigma-70 family)